MENQIKKFDSELVRKIFSQKCLCRSVDYYLLVYLVGTSVRVQASAPDLQSLMKSFYRAKSDYPTVDFFMLTYRLDVNGYCVSL